jgi:hypothetical protein
LNVECLVWMSETTNVTNLKKEWKRKSGMHFQLDITH